MFTRTRNRLAASRGQGGFTLIELLIVIVILGILAAIVIFGVGTFRQDSKDACNDTNAKQLEVAQEAYNAKFGVAGASKATLEAAGYLKANAKTC